MNNYFSFIPLYNSFIEKYMIKSNPSFVIIYIYLLKKSINRKDIYLEEIASKLNILASDIIKALEYWKDEKIISYSQVENKVEISFFNVEESKIEENVNEKQVFNVEKKGYTDEEITIYSQQEEIQRLFRLAEKKLAKTLTYRDREILITLYEHYGMSLEILTVLFTYCIENGKNNLNYIEKVAIDWSENNIDTLEKVEAYRNMYNNDFKKIMRFFGIFGTTPIKEQEDYMKIWILEYKMPLNVIEQACTKTVMKLGNPSFKYAHSILKSWYDKGIKSLEDVKKIQEDYGNEIKLKEEEKRKTQNLKNNSNIYYGTNKFTNYKQRPIDYEMLRKIELKDLKGD